MLGPAPNTVIYHETVNVQPGTLRRLRDTWRRVAPEYPAYDLLLPGDPAFICQAEACAAHCCRTFSVPVGEADLCRMQTVTGLQPVDFLESEDGTPIALPLAEPYLLARSDGQCRLLGDDLTCTRYEGRPTACRVYPHQVLWVSERSGRPVNPGAGRVEENFARWLSGEGDTVALLLRHLECPGFTGAPIDEDRWAALLLETARLQLGEDSSPDWPGLQGHEAAKVS